MKIKCLGCEALARILYHCAANSKHLIDVELFELGLHNEPAGLRTTLQDRIDALKGSSYDAIVLAYGLCGESTAEIKAHDIPIVIPRAHDCITLFLGSREKYQEEFNSNPGTYWYALDYIERNKDAGTSLGYDMEMNLKELYEEYVEKFGTDNAEYLMTVMGAWQQNYKRAAFIDMGIGDGKSVEEEAQKEAAQRGWTYESLPGDYRIIKMLLDGEWGEDCLVLQPGEQIDMTYDDAIITNSPTQSKK